MSSSRRSWSVVVALFVVASGCGESTGPGFGDPTCALAPEVQLELACSDEPLRVAADPGFAQITAGFDHTCALTPEGEAFCWGWNRSGELATGGTGVVTTPTRVQTHLRFAQIAAGASYTCAIAIGGGAYCWGASWGGESLRSTPTLVPGGGELRAVGAGTNHTCGVDTHGAGYCWGTDWYGELGRGSWDPNALHADSVARPVVGGLTLAAIDGGQRFTCALDADGRAHCWGFGHQGQLGTQNTSLCPDLFATRRCSPWPVPVGTSRSFTTLATGAGHVCALSGDGEVWCWGEYGQGQTGRQTLSDPFVPLAVAGVRFTQLAVGQFTTCGITPAGEAVCWGLNNWRQLARGSREYADEKPGPVQGGHRFQALSVGYGHGCGITTAGSTLCWGGNEWGQLGVGRR
jgi:alpha-tubulin suppressor-like RCC1 family protein